MQLSIYIKQKNLIETHNILTKNQKFLRAQIKNCVSKGICLTIKYKLQVWTKRVLSFEIKKNWPVLMPSVELHIKIILTYERNKKRKYTKIIQKKAKRTQRVSEWERTEI